MNKRTITIADTRSETTQIAVVTERKSWMPSPAFPLATLDPAHWSDRKRQANLWRLLDQLSRHRVVH